MANHGINSVRGGTTRTGGSSAPGSTGGIGGIGGTTGASSGRVFVRGDGLVACAAALALARLGLPVELQGMAPQGPAVPPAAAPQPDVRTYALNAASRALLQQLKVWDALPPHAVCPVLDMHIEGDDGAQLEFSAWQQGAEALAWIVDAAALESVMRQALRYAPHIQLRAEAPALVMGASAPSTSTRDLLLLCEGKDSQSRAALGVHFDKQAYGHHALATRVVSDQPHAGVASQWFGQPDVLALLPIDQPQPGQGYGVVWSMPADKAQALMAADDASFEHALMQATGGQCGALRLGGARRTWPLMLGRADRVHGPGWMLLGDCAHAVHPLAGQGLNLGLADVAALARVMAEREAWRDLGDEKLLARAARERVAPTLAVASLTDGLWHLFAHPNPLVRSLRNRGMNLLNQLPLLKRSLTRRAMGLGGAASFALACALGLAGGHTPAQAQAAGLSGMSGAPAAPGAANPTASATAGSTTPSPQEAAIRKALTERMPSLPKPDEVQRAPVPGLWELRFGSEILYTDERGDFLISGPIVETRSRKDLTAERIDKLTAIQFASLPFKDAIVIKQGTGARRLVVFSDPNCGFCKRYERELLNLKDVTLYTFLYPILGKDSLDKSRNIWCAADPAKAWRDWMVDGRLPPAAAAKCDASALDRNTALGQRHRVESTPTSVLEDGTRRSGAFPLNEVERLINSSRPSKS
jgi:ubiquinone biosynthesis UbiH/UbiF/VisC/COQ6 family hydroxylase